MKTNKEMIDSITEEIKRHNKNTAVRKKAIITLTAIFTLLISLIVGVGASGFFGIATPAYKESLKNRADNASTTYETEELRQLIEKSDDIFSVASRNDKGSNRQILLDYKTSTPVNETVTDGEYTYTFKSITEGKKLNNVVTSGSLFYGTAEFEWQVSDSLYALFEINRVDGNKITDDNYTYFRNHNYIIGIEPLLAYMTFTKDTIYARNDYTYHMAIELDEMCAFAGDEFVICFFDDTRNAAFVEDADPRKDIYATEDGIFEIKDHFTRSHALFRFRIDEKYFDKNTFDELKEQNKDTVFFTPNYDFYK